MSMLSHLGFYLLLFPNNIIDPQVFWIHNLLCLEWLEQKPHLLLYPAERWAPGNLHSFLFRNLPINLHASVGVLWTLTDFQGCLFFNLLLSTVYLFPKL